MNHEVAAPDAIVQLGTALDDVSTRVARREHELNRIFEPIAVERSSLLDAVHTRVTASVGAAAAPRFSALSARLAAALPALRVEAS